MSDNVPDVAMAEYARLKDELAVIDHMGFGDDLVAIARIVEQTRFVRDILKAHALEQRAKTRLDRAPLRAALYRALGAVEDDDLDALCDTMLEVADIVGRPR